MRAPEVRQMGWVLFAAAAVAAGLGVFAVMRDRVATEKDVGDFELLQARLASMEVKMSAIVGRCDSLQAETVGQSNRADVAEARLLEERKTHEPLRQQIEKNIAQDITFKAEIDRKDSELRTLAASVQKAGADLASLRAEVQKLAAQAEGLQAKLKAAAGVEASLRVTVAAMDKRASEAESRATNAEKALGELRQGLKAAQETLASEQAKAVRLASERDALKREAAAAGKAVEAGAPVKAEPGK